MGCGHSKGALVVVEGDEPLEVQNPPEVPGDTNGSNPMYTPDHSSELITPPGVNKHNGTSIQPQNVDNNHVDTPIMAKKLGKKESVAFDVTEEEESSKSLIKKHPPRKFQKLEEIQITPEDLVAKQTSAQERRQKIMTQRVQSAKLRSAKVRTINSEIANDAEQNGDSVIESPPGDL